jgi:hypothetical protein
MEWIYQIHLPNLKPPTHRQKDYKQLIVSTVASKGKFGLEPTHASVTRLNLQKSFRAQTKGTPLLHTSEKCL